MKNKNGITLIALVVTIIILLILAGVTIASLIENGLFEQAKISKEKTEKSTATEILMTKIYSYQIYEMGQGEKTTLEGLQEYLKEDEEIEYLNLYIETASLIPVELGQVSTHAKVKLKKYKYEFILNQELNIVELNEETIIPELENMKIDAELEKLLNEANMKITLEDILNTPAIMENITGLIPILTESDVTRNEEDNVIIYTDNKGGVTRTNSEYSSTSTGMAWYAFDNNVNTKAASKNGEAQGYYLEYEFPQEVYAMQIKYIFTNESSWEGNRVIVIQGYDENNEEWMDLTEDITWTGTANTKEEEKINLNYSQPYKKYRIYVKESTSNNSYGHLISGLCEMQFFGGKSSKIENNTEENLIKLLLSNSNSNIITLAQMATNEEFITRLINALSIKTVEENEILMANLPGLIPTLTENDVTRSEINNVITYTDNNGGIIRTNSEKSTTYIAWYAFDNNIATSTLSQTNQSVGYYLEYEFPKEIYAMQIKYIVTNGSSREGNRVIVIQGYDENNKDWMDLTEDITWTGTGNTKKEEKVGLNYTKTYKKYRIYVKESTSNNSYGHLISGFYNIQFYGKLAN